MDKSGNGNLAAIAGSYGDFSTLPGDSYVSPENRRQGSSADLSTLMERLQTTGGSIFLNILRAIHMSRSLMEPISLCMPLIQEC